MRILSFQIIIFVAVALSAFAQSPHGDDFNIDCSECHNSETWNVDLTQITFNHSQTDFELIGQHVNVNCTSCHKTLEFSKVPQDCISCHKDIHQGTVGFDCAKCHTPAGWIVKDINGLHQNERFPLVGAHKIADCAQCHSGYAQLNFEPLDIDCYFCHSENYLSAQNPNHVSANFSTECQDCHSINAFAWNATNVDHSFFPLVGGHALPSCFSCHEQGGNFSGLSNECYSCHQQNYQSTQNPNHIAAGLPTTCEVCHNIYGWQPASFNHDVTVFPLTGKHVNVDCANCHTNGYTGTPTDCYACHRQDYESTDDPNHVTQGFPTDCQQCHTTNGWDDAEFDHSLTAFPLTGRHVQVQCSSCHTNGYSGTPTDCYACHQQDYESTTDPNHIAQGYPTDCQQCHTTNGWDGAQIDHNLTAFPLTGRHIQVQCSSCHTNGYTGTPTDCYACHRQDYESTNDPNHVTEGYPTDCLQCHTTSGWDGANFNHSNTSFPLTGSHIQVQCSSCHTNGYAGTPTDCYSCHRQNYESTTDPNHVVEGFSTECQQCHNTSNWGDASYDHSNTSFPLTGAHTTATCASCHSTGYTNTPTECSSCHITDYNNSTNPNHQAAGFPQTCNDCHSTTAWQPATFDHDGQYFPIYSGSHNGKWNLCSDCHTSSSNYSVFSCITCHEHNQTEMDTKHAGVQGYIYASTECLACHPDGSSANAFRHELSNFPLLGAHQTLDCSQCHQSGFSGTSSLCSDCHINDYNTASNPNHQALSIPTDCASCHTADPGWSPASFSIHNQYYELLGAHSQIANDCASCHNGNYTTTPNTCIECHNTDYNATNDPPHSTLNFSDDCLSCHTMNGWSPANFDHGFYPISSRHSNVSCGECHSQSAYQPQCLSCHQDDFNEKHDPGDPTDCWSCHTTNDWDDGTRSIRKSIELN